MPRELSTRQGGSTGCREGKCKCKFKGSGVAKGVQRKMEA